MAETPVHQYPLLPLALLVLSLSLSFSFLFLFVFSLYFKTHRKNKAIAQAQTPSPLTERDPPCQSQTPSEEEQLKGGEKKRKKRGKKKKQSGSGSDGCDDPKDLHPTVELAADGTRKGITGTDYCPFPFSSFASATQRRIKLKYEELVRSNQAQALTTAQVGQFIDCLIEARNELQHKSELIQRSFKIKKALLFKADRSSFDRLCQQVCKLEAEHKRLEEDAAVYNLLQEQLKLSPAYKTMLEISAKMETKSADEQSTEIPDISFEELLAQEKKDSFWQKNGKLRSITD